MHVSSGQQAWDCPDQDSQHVKQQPGIWVHCDNRIWHASIFPLFGMGWP
jgi:hypothetical protein